MSCFIVPAAEAVVTTIVTKVVRRSEEKAGEKAALPMSEKLGWLNKMLWGGSGLLAFEHLWHGELSPVFPFFTAAQSPEQLSLMLHETATSGTAMAVIVTLVWAAVSAAGSLLIKRGGEPSPAEEGSGA